MSVACVIITFNFLLLPWLANTIPNRDERTISETTRKYGRVGWCKIKMLLELCRIQTASGFQCRDLQTDFDYSELMKCIVWHNFYTGATIPKTTGWLVTVTIDEVKPDNKDVLLMEKICKWWKIRDNVSPLCNNRDLYWNLKKISAAKNVSFELMVGITYTESHIGANFKPEKCFVHNNRGGKKAKKLDDGTMVRPQSMPLKDWCRLYHFDTVEEYRNSFANTLKMWYIDKWCSTPECISRYYVKNDWVIKTWRCSNIRKFYQ